MYLNNFFFSFFSPPFFVVKSGLTHLHCSWAWTVDWWFSWLLHYIAAVLRARCHQGCGRAEGVDHVFLRFLVFFFFVRNLLIHKGIAFTCCELRSTWLPDSFQPFPVCLAEHRRIPLIGCGGKRALSAHPPLIIGTLPRNLSLLPCIESGTWPRGWTAHTEHTSWQLPTANTEATCGAPSTWRQGRTASTRCRARSPHTGHSCSGPSLLWDCFRWLPALRSYYTWQVICRR